MITGKAARKAIVLILALLALLLIRTTGTI